MKTGAAVTLIATRLAAVGIAEPRREARLILAAAMNTDAAGVLAAPEIDPECFAPHVARRETREPLAYITGRREFWGLTFLTSPATLIPRPDSETLIESAIAGCAGRQPRTILDLGTGTGCLLLAALQEFGGSFGIGVDIAPAAAALARQNATALGLAGRAAFLAGHWADSLRGTFDLVLANPPYIPAAAIAGLMPEVRDFEPARALDGGPDGLDAYRHIMAALPALLAPEGLAVCEVGTGQAKTVGDMAEQAGFAVQTRADLANIARALVLRPCSPAGVK